jgi:3-oxoacyl-[acyl-carrier-protein] synthase-1
MTGLSIEACGMTTAIGLTAPAAAAAQRARLSNFEETHFISHDGKWMIGAEVPLDPPRRGRARLQALLEGPLRECYAALGDIDAKDVPVLLCVAEGDRPGRLHGVDLSLLHDTLNAIGQPIHADSAVISYGRVGGIVALRDARELMKKGAKKVIVAGVDSYLLAGTLAQYDADDRVLTETNSNGFPAGEAGAAVLLGRDGLFQVLGLGFGREPAHITSGEPMRADGLVMAMRAALSEAGLDFSDVDYRISDLNGEQYYFKEAALAMTRVLRKRREQMDLWNPASEFGFTGAASIPLMLGLGLIAGQKRYAPGRTVIMQTSDDDGRRGTAILRMEG